jgi:hypothetical protein
MPYKTRLLPVEEWDKLKNTEAGPVYHLFDREHTNVMVVEKDSIVVGSWSLIPYYHAECVWIEESHRGNPAVVKRLVAGMKQMANLVGTSSVITTSLDYKTTKLLEHLEATRLPGEHYVIHFGR